MQPFQVPEFFFPGKSRIAVENDEMRLPGPNFIGVFSGLFQPLPDDFLQATALNFRFNADLLYIPGKTLPGIQRPFNTKVGTFTTQGVLPVYSAATIDNSLQKRLNQ